MTLFFLSILAPLILGTPKEPEVTVYCSLDQIYSEPILKDFEKKTGIRVKPVYDIEANKTLGLVRTLIEEKNHPHCDVFWNNELANTIKLKRQGVLQPYLSPQGKEIPAAFRDAEGYWAGFAARCRVIMFNKEKCGAFAPSTLADFLDPKWKGKCVIGKPLSGSTFVHFAALFSVWGEEKMKKFVDGLLANEVGIAPGNAHVSKLVAKGVYAFGLTDTDDFFERLEEGAPVQAVYIDSKGEGTLFFPNSVGLIKNCPHPEQGKKLIDFLLRPETEAGLAAGSSAQIPLRAGIPGPPKLQLGEFRAMKLDWEKVVDEMDKRAAYLQEIFAAR